MCGIVGIVEPGDRPVDRATLGAMCRTMVHRGPDGSGMHVDGSVGLAMQRALDKTEGMKARADAVSELEAAGTFEDIAQLGPAQDDIDRQLEQLGRSNAVDEDLAKLKAELGQGTEAAPELDPGAPAEETQR